MGLRERGCRCLPVPLWMDVPFAEVPVFAGMRGYRLVLLLRVQHPANEVVYEGAIGVAFPVFHDAVVEVDVEFLG